MSSAPVGVFDSGLGGLTVVRAIRRRLPREPLLYFGDTARVPYGNKSPDLVREYARDIARFLVERGAKTLVVACNTASALALEHLRAEIDVPVLGVIEPGVDAALREVRRGRVGVIGTIATIHSRAYSHLLRQKRPGLEVISQACPLFVPLVEEGWLEDDVTYTVARRYLQVFAAEPLDALILGCTHYPLLKPVLRQVVNGATALVDSAAAVAGALEEALRDHQLLSEAPEPGKLDVFVTDFPARFETVARTFLGHALDQISLVHLP